MSGLAINLTNVPALPSSRTIGNHWWTAITRFYTASPTVDAESAVPSRRGPRPRRRYDYLEQAAMSRAMERL